MEKNKQKKKRGGSFGLFGWLAALLLLIGGGGFGLYEAGVFGSDGSVDMVGESGVVNLSVSGDEISWNGDSITQAELLERVEALETDASFTLSDDEAIKATYEEVLKVLESHELEYQETESL